MLLQALAQEGVEVDPVTLFASLTPPIGRNGTATGILWTILILAALKYRYK